MTWVKNVHGVEEWQGEFVEPSDANLAGYGNRRSFPFISQRPEKKPL